MSVRGRITFLQRHGGGGPLAVKTGCRSHHIMKVHQPELHTFTLLSVLALQTMQLALWGNNRFEEPSDLHVPSASRTHNAVMIAIVVTELTLPDVFIFPFSLCQSVVYSVYCEFTKVLHLSRTLALKFYYYVLYTPHISGGTWCYISIIRISIFYFLLHYIYSTANLSTYFFKKKK